MNEIPAGREARARLLVVAVGVAALLAQWATLFLGHGGDFHLHWNWGRRFVAGDFLYAGGVNIPYPPFWAMAWAPLTLVPVRAAQVLVFPAAVLALLLLLRILQRLTRETWPLGAEGIFWTAALAVFLSSRFLLRDLADSGPNLILTTCVWLGIFLWTRERDLAGGVCLGIAIALKMTSAIFLGYFLWKRQWKMAAASALAALFLTAAPILRLGPSSYLGHMAFWIETALEAGSGGDPSVGVLGPEPVQNLALRATLGRLLRGARPRPPSPVRADEVFLAKFSARQALAAVLVVEVLLGAAVVWRVRRPLSRRDSPEVLAGLAAVGVLSLLFSPITWGQHGVAAIPACYLVARRALASGKISATSLALLLFFVTVVLFFNRTFVGRDFDLLVQGAGLSTLALVSLLVLTLGADWPRQAGLEARSPEKISSS